MGKTSVVTLIVFMYHLPSSICLAGTEDANPYVEFLWSGSDGGQVARAEANVFLKDLDHDHEICLKWPEGATTRQIHLRIDAIDAAGMLISSSDYPRGIASVQCHRVDLGEDSASGLWKFQVYVDESQRTDKEIFVADTIEEAATFLSTQGPFVVGRPNYDESIDPADFFGHVVWEMQVNKEGAVIEAEVIDAVGAGLKMSERALEAAYLYKFFPDPARGDRGVRFRQRYELKPTD